MPVSIAILTLNEETNLPNCLNSLKWSDDIVILDSFSADKTKIIAESYNCRFFQRKFDDYASQRNYALNEIQYKNEWVLMVDADEVVPDDLKNEIIDVVTNADTEIALIRFRRKDYFNGKWIKHSSGYPTWFGRVLKIGATQIVRPINEEYTTEGKVIHLQGHIHHYTFNKGLADWLDKHNRYSTLEAEYLSTSRTAINFMQLFDRDPTIRRRVHKQILYKMPFRPLIIFFYLFVIKGGFLYGKEGLNFCALRMFYELMINLKAKGN